MARKRRAWDARFFYHVVMRGNNRQVIFQNEDDFAELFRAMQYAYDQFPFIVASYCMLNNHFHLLIRSPNAPLGKVMAALNKRYSDYYRKKYHYTGHLYESRYFAVVMVDAQGMLEVSRYIHRNPIATTTPMVSRMEHYPYSSYPFYKKNELGTFPFMNTTILPSLLPPSYAQNAEGYCVFCEESPES